MKNKIKIVKNQLIYQNIYRRNRYKTDITYRLNYIIRNYIKQGIDGKRKIGNLKNIIGYTILELKKHLEMQFKKGMTWNNHGYNGWNIDHIKPICSFSYNSYGDRRDSAGVSKRENFPMALILNILIRFDIVSWVGFRNTYVTNGSGGEKDRRLGVSQNFISIDQNKDGNMDVNVLYIPFFDFSKKDTVTIPIGG